MTKSLRGSPGWPSGPGTQSAGSPWASLRTRHWATHSESPWVQIVALHGLQSHSGWYTHSSARMAEAGCDVVFLDRRGSGLNCGPRGHAETAQQLIDDVVAVLSALRSAHSLPIVLMGISWGARLAMAVTIARPDLVDAVALLSPGLFPKSPPTWTESLALRFAGAMGWGLGRVTIPRNDATLLTSDLRWQEFTRRDELALHNVTVSFLLANRDLMRRVETAREIPKPALMILAGRDALIDNVRSRKWFERVAVESRRIIEYPHALHTLEFEPNWDCIVDDLLAWVRQIVVRKM